MKGDAGSQCSLPRLHAQYPREVSGDSVLNAPDSMLNAQGGGWMSSISQENVEICIEYSNTQGSTLTSIYHNQI